jgi:energy-converting hydrogenase Eha subunit H
VVVSLIRQKSILNTTVRNHLETMRGKLPIFGIAAAMAAVLATLMITAATLGLIDLVSEIVRK